MIIKLIIVLFVVLNFFKFANMNPNASCTQLPFSSELYGFNQRICDFIINQNANANECTNPDEDKLHEIILNHSEFFIKQEFFDSPEFFSKYRDIPRFRNLSDNSLVNYTIGEKDCIFRNRTQPNEIGVCPWHYKIHYRENRYPYYRKEAICNCQHCHNVMRVINDTERLCRPIKKNFPILYRGNPVQVSSSKCEYEMKLAFEEVTVACECMVTRRDKRISKRSVST